MGASGVRRRRWAALWSTMLLLSGCGGDGGGASTGGATATATPATTTPATTTVVAGCSVLDRQNWAAAQLREWYLFPETLPASLDPAPYATVADYVDALTATARAQGRDRYFTYLTSISAENAYYEAGSSAGYGLRLSIDAVSRVFVTEAFENAPALAAGIDRGTQILAIGTSASDLRQVSAIIAAEGASGVTSALGPNTAGVSRLLRVSTGGVTRDVVLTKADFTLLPVSSRYGARIIEDGDRRFGYLNLRTFITTADPALRAAFADFRAQGITGVVVDLRYNGGGLVSTAELLGDLLGGNRAGTDIFDYMTFRPEKAANNTQHAFTQQPQSIAPVRLAFIGTGGTASASELVINAFTPFLHGASALIGTNTYGKPVGQIALDRPACDDRLRLVAFATENAAHQGAYFNGLATKVDASCQAADDLAQPLGSPQEASTRAALDFLQGRSCTPITAEGRTAQATGGQGGELQAVPAPRALLVPARPDPAQREVPGLF